MIYLPTERIHAPIECGTPCFEAPGLTEEIDVCSCADAQALADAGKIPAELLPDLFDYFCQTGQVLRLVPHEPRR